MDILLWHEILEPYELAVKELQVKFRHLIKEHHGKGLYSPIESVSGRVKSVSSILEKMQRKGIVPEEMEEQVEDIAGIRIICSFNQDIYQIADMIARQKDVTVLYVKDYIRKPKPNGYKSYHMVVTIPIYLTEGPVETKVEIQIRTIAMDFWASLEHKIAYKFEGKAPDYLERELKSCADMVDMLDMKMFSLNQAIMAVEEEERRVEEEKRREREKAEKRQEELAGNGPT